MKTYAWVIGVPVILMLLPLVLGWMEETLVAPIDRAVRINVLLERAAPEDIEREVAMLLARIEHRSSVRIRPRVEDPTG